ncbi:Protein kinase C-like 1 [Sticta canariensis]|nr:Protein kinase C-like 1 [Sticta canariensis]
MPSKGADIETPSKPPISISYHPPLPPPSADFKRQQASRQVGNAYHASSHSTMIPRSVNRTSLHPGGVEPQRDHTEIEEELHELAHIDYDRVSIIANPSVAALYEDALVYETGSAITSTGALTAFSGAKTGRSPLDKRIVREPSSENEVWWGPVNKPMTPEAPPPLSFSPKPQSLSGTCSHVGFDILTATLKVWKINRERAVDYLNTKNRIYVVDGFAGWDERYRINVRVVCARAYHALFMRNMLIRPSEKELEHFHPDYTIYNAGSFPANRFTTGMTSATSVAINFAAKEMVILGTEYAGEMKKGIFTVLFYEMPVKHNVLTLHSSANEGADGDVTVFFGLSGTGKTTLSADPKRALIGDDEHCWSDRGVFNIEGGCYAKTIGLSAEKEPDIFNAIRFGSILENVVFSPDTRLVNFDDSTLTENTRCAYPIEYIQNAKIPCLSMKHPSNIILLTCDARGVLPPISKLTVEQTMFHFISGYTSKMAGTEDGVTEPQATFSSCFAQPFLALHPMRYARMLADKIAHHKANAWLLNTGWVGAGASTGGKRCPLKYTRAILDSIHSGELAKAEYETYETFNLHVPTSCAGVPSELLNPRKSWTGKADFKEEVTKLAGLFVENFQKYADEASPEVISAGECKDKNQQNRSNTVDVGPDMSTNESKISPDVLAPSEASYNCTHAPVLIESSDPTVNGETAEEDPGFMTNGVEVSTEERGNFTESNGVPHEVSDVETKAKAIRDSGIGFVDGEDSPSGGIRIKKVLKSDRFKLAYAHPNKSVKSPRLYE